MLAFQANPLHNQTREGYWGHLATAGSRVPDHSRQKLRLLKKESPAGCCSLDKQVCQLMPYTRPWYSREYWTAHVEAVLKSPANLSLCNV